MSRRTRDARYTATESLSDDRPDVVGVADTIDYDKLARLTLVVFVVLFTVYVDFLCLAIIVDSPLVSTGLSVSSILSGVTFGFGMIVEFLR